MGIVERHRTPQRRLICIAAWPAMLAAGLTLFLAPVVAPPPARAEIIYPWCFLAAGRDSYTNCGFVSYAQCRATAIGTGGQCYQNPAYQPGPPVRRAHQPRD